MENNSNYSTNNRNINQNIKVYIISSPIVHLPIGIILALLFTSFLGYIFISCLLLEGFSFKFYLVSVVCSGAILYIFVRLTIALIEDFLHHLSFRKVKRQITFSNLELYQEEATIELKISDARKSLQEKDRVFEILTSRGVGASPTDEMPLALPGFIEEYESSVVSGIEIFQEGEKFYCQIPGISEKVEFGVVAKWKNSAKSDLEKRYSEKRQTDYINYKAIYDKCLQLRNTKYIDSYLRDNRLSEQAEIVACFCEPKIDNLKKAYNVTGTPSCVLKYINAHITSIDMKATLPDPLEFGVKVEPYGWKNSLQANTLAYGCIFDIISHSEIHNYGRK